MKLPTGRLPVKLDASIPRNNEALAREKAREVAEAARDNGYTAGPQTVADYAKRHVADLETRNRNSRLPGDRRSRLHRSTPRPARARSRGRRRRRFGAPGAACLAPRREARTALSGCAPTARPKASSRRTEDRARQSSAFTRARSGNSYRMRRSRWRGVARRRSARNCACARASSMLSPGTTSTRGDPASSTCTAQPADAPGGSRR